MYALNGEAGLGYRWGEHPGGLIVLGSELDRLFGNARIGVDLERFEADGRCRCAICPVSARRSPCARSGAP